MSACRSIANAVGGTAAGRTRGLPPSRRSAAEAAYREGVTSRRSSELARVAEEMFCSSWGDDALAALGELALERGDYAAARRAWEHNQPGASRSAREGTVYRLYDVDLGQHVAGNSIALE